MFVDESVPGAGCEVEGTNVMATQLRGLFRVEYVVSDEDLGVEQLIESTDAVAELIDEDIVGGTTREVETLQT